jgi:hypothetical protein
MMISVEFRAVVLFEKVLESSSLGVVVEWENDKPVAVFFVSPGSSDEFFSSERFLWLG